MATTICARRLQKEYMNIKKTPVENIEVHPLEDNILEWHYCIFGTKGTLYEGGYYHGVLKFPREYPLKPPSVLMHTPNGRFKTHTRLCLSMSDYHPETWNPMWSVSTILMGLYSFMLEETSTLGSIRTPKEQVRRLARESLAANCKDRQFQEIFPHLVEKYHEQREKEKEAQEQAQLMNGDRQEKVGPSASQDAGAVHQKIEGAGFPVVVVGALGCILVAYILNYLVKII
mmetsp:Transcript_12476/g.23584  ORF Transcript_12476/g.23584 Transcript_12476/m.23584 type:complete len:230 (+) Transcript_12476:28-717(+)